MHSAPPLLIIEADPAVQAALCAIFASYPVLLARTAPEALQYLDQDEPPVTILNLGLDQDTASGLDTLRRVLLAAPAAKVIVLTDPRERAAAVAAIGLGAYNFFEKPIDAEILSLLVSRAFRMQELEAENRRLSEQGTATPMAGLLTASPAMQAVCRTIEKVAPSGASVLLLGESGTGKELLARALHNLSPRRSNRFVAVNCAAIPETLLESELFGYEKGAFTGAVRQVAGKIECANGGTFFLDEIGDLPPALQAKLLRFLQERVIERIGGRAEVPIDVRIVCATHCDLGELIRTRQFREDLYYRISEINIEIPPLRARPGDAALLAHAFLEKYAAGRSHALRGFSNDALAALDRHAFPGNVRELENCVKRAVILSETPWITAADLGLAALLPDERPINLRRVREEAERAALTRALARTDGNIAQAAELLGISRPTLYDLLHRLGLRTMREAPEPPCQQASQLSARSPLGRL